MTRRRAAATALGTLAMVAIVGSFVVGLAEYDVLDRRDRGAWGGAAAFGSAVGWALFVVAGTTVVRHRPGNRLGWLLLLAGAAGGLATAANTFVWFGAYTDRYGMPYRDLYDLPGRAYAGWAYGSLNRVSTAAVFGLLLLYPDGRLPSRRWRPLAVVVMGVAAIGVLEALFAPGPVRSSLVPTQNPFGIEALRFLRYRIMVFEDQEPVARMALIVAFLGAAFAPAVRWTRHRARAQVPLGLFALCAAIEGLSFAGFLGTFAAGVTNDTTQLVGALVLLVAHLGLAVATIDAVFRHRLDEIEVAVRRTAVFGAMSLLVAIAYAATTAGVGSVAARAGASWAVPLSATGIAAVGLQPARSWAEGFASRLVFGERVGPARLLELLAARVAGANDVLDLLPRLAATLASAFGAEEVTVAAGDHHVTRGTAPATGLSLATDVVFGSERVGRIGLVRSLREPWTDDERELVALVAGQVAPAFNNVVVEDELRRRADEAAAQAEALAASQRRLTVAQLAARARFAEDVHERVMPLLDAVEDSLAFDDPAGARSAAERALAEVRRIGHGLDPSDLRDLGPVAALAAEARELGTPIELDVRGPVEGRWPEQVERTVFLAVASVVRVAGSDRVQVEIDRRPTGVVFRAMGGRPLSDLAAAEIEDRVAALGGTLRTEAGELAGWIPT